MTRRLPISRTRDRRTRPRASLIVVLAALALAWLTLGQSGGMTRTLGSIGEALGIATETPGGLPDAADPPADGLPTSGEAVAIPSEAQTMTVEYVHDGDTLFVTTSAGARLKVRLIGVDTPELGGECHAEEARAALRALLPVGAAVRAAHDTDHQDRYGRELLYVWTAAGVFVNLDLVNGGHGTALRIGANDAHWPQLVAAEASAQSAGLGLWSAC